MSSNTIINSMNNMSKRKGTSFQITSVSVSSGNNQQPQQQRDNNGDDSADDLDESHTDDNISRITDYETPSFSEDTFSREDVFFAQPNALGTAPVIPTSSQYGLAIVGPDLSGNGANLSDVHVSVSDAGINIMGQLPNKQDVDHKNERFKVVKIESTEPFKRGRWMCMDYLDHTTLQAQDDGIDGSPKEDGDENVVRTKDSGLESGMEGSEMNDNGDMDHDNEGLDQEVMRAEMMNNHGGDAHHTSHEQQHHHMTMTSIPIHNEINLGAQQSQAQSMPQGHIQQIISQHEKPNESTTRGEMNPSSDTLPTHASQTPSFVGSNQQHTFVADNNSPMMPHHAQSMTPDMIQRSLQQHDQQAHNQGVTLPTNILMQNLGLEHQHGNASSHQATSSPLPTQGESAGEMENRQQPHQLLQDSQTSQFQNQQVGAGDNKHQPSNESEQGSGASTNDNLINNSVSDMNNMNSNDGTQNTLSPSSSAGLGTVAEGGSAVGGGASELNSNNASNAAAPGADDGQSIAEDSER